MSRKKFVDGIWIQRRMDGLDRRYQARAGRPDRRAIDAVEKEAKEESQAARQLDGAIEGFRARTRKPFPKPPVPAVVTVAIVPVDPEPVGLVVEVALVPIEEDATDGDACGSWCGYCGRCSDGPRANATCSDCGADFFKGRDDVGTLCDACCSQRDAHADALEIRMAKVVLPAKTQKDVA